jgi:2-polyprenyl-3-methyl-5-hydroxy-6-metoxy-1,4-benzoquinol methylase
LAPSRDEREARDLFAERYGRPGSDATRDVERLVIGSDFGANGYTTVAQADLLSERLGLAAGKHLLDIGSGRGWPGLYLARESGCNVVLTDLPVEAMRTAARRAGEEGLLGRARMVVSSARRLPFGPATQDAIVHTDVLC